MGDVMTRTHECDMPANVRSIPFRMEKAKRHASVIARISRDLARTLRVSAVLALAACSGETPEQVLRAELAGVQAAIEQGDVQKAISVVSEDFGGPNGMDRAALHNLLRMQVIGGRRIGVTTTPFRIDIQGDDATVTFDAVLTGSGQGRWMPDRAGAYEVTTGWRFSGDDWQLHHADWQARR